MELFASREQVMKKQTCYSHNRIFRIGGIFAFVPRSTICQPETRVSLQDSSRQSQRDIKSEYQLNLMEQMAK